LGWRRAQAVAVGDIKTLPGGMFEITYRLYDIVKKESLGGTTITDS
jgi:TolB protein